jgi:uncharacterized protein
VPDLSAAQQALLVAGAVCVGFSKTGVSVAASVAVALFAAALPARESTGTLLPLLVLGDVLAVALYRRHADRPALLRLFPAVAVGVLAGVGVLAVVGDLVLRRTIGVVVLVLVAVHLWSRRADRGVQAEVLAARRHRRRHVSAGVFGALAGFTTMVANAGAPVMAIYLLRSGVGVLAFLGTTAWFFFVVNLFKLPFSAGLGLLTAESLRLDLWLVPGVLVGAAAGHLVVRRIDPGRFEAVVLALVVLASANLLR